jgi:hypothetical protein
MKYCLILEEFKCRPVGIVYKNGKPIAFDSREQAKTFAHQLMYADEEWLVGFLFYICKKPVIVAKLKF